jgi:hypothetical protein
MARPTNETFRRQQINKPTQIVVPEMCTARSDDDRRIVRDEISPGPRESCKLPCIVVEEDAVLAPRLTTFD